jgi:hypothetical protein
MLNNNISFYEYFSFAVFNLFFDNMVHFMDNLLRISCPKNDKRSFFRKPGCFLGLARTADLGLRFPFYPCRTLKIVPL